MSWPLRQSTASQEIPLGPFLDTDGVAVTSLTVANTDIKLQKNGATSQANKNSGGATHIAAGDYYCVLDATDTDTVGPLRVKVHVAGALPAWLDCMVYEEAVYDALFAASALGYVANAPVNVAQWLGSAPATPTVAGVPEVDVTHVGGAAASAGVVEANVTQIGGQTVTCAAPVTVLASVGTAATSTAQTGDGYAILSSGTHGNAALKTILDAVKVKSDQLTFGVANVLNANITYVNEVPVVGSGTEADPWEA